MLLHAKLSFLHTLFLENEAKIHQSNYRTMRFMSKQVSLGKISSILKKMKIDQKPIYALFAWRPSIILIYNTLWHVFEEKEEKYHLLECFIIFLVFKARLSLQVHNNCHLCCHGISGGNKTLLGICWKSSGKGILTSTDLLVY